MNGQYRLHYLPLFVPAIAVLACGGAGRRAEPAAAGAAPGIPPVLSGPHSPYEAACEKRVATHMEAVSGGRWVPPVLRTRLLGTDGAFEPVTVEVVADRLVDGTYGALMVEARGGLGKSKLLEAIEAASCARVPVFRVHASNDLPREGTAAAIEAAIRAKVERAAGVEPGDEARRAALARVLAGRWVLLVDSLDEVPPPRRLEVGRALNALRASVGDGLRMAVFMRPPVFLSSVDAFGISRVVEIVELDCDAARERVRVLTGDPASEAAFWEFARSCGLDRRERGGKGCRFVHLATYRDVETAVSVARDSGFRNAEAMAGRGRAALYERYLSGALTHALRLAGDMAVDALAFLDGMVDAAGPDEVTRGLEVRKAHCIKALGFGGGRAEAVCDAVLSGVLFRRVESRDSYAFRNQSVVDLLLARWADRRLREPGRPECSRIAELAGLFESTEVVSFLVGLPGGAACAGAVVRALCQSGCWPLQTARLVDQGLDTQGRARLREALSETPGDDATGRCMKAIVDDLAD